MKIIKNTCWHRTSFLAYYLTVRRKSYKQITKESKWPSPSTIKISKIIRSPTGFLLVDLCRWTKQERPLGKPDGLFVYLHNVFNSRVSRMVLEQTVDLPLARAYKFKSCPENQNKKFQFRCSTVVVCFWLLIKKSLVRIQPPEPV